MNWKSILATAFITGLVTIATGIMLFWWQTEKPELTYNSIRSIPFDNASNKLFIQQVEIKNSGDKPAEDVVLVISFTDEIIQKSKVTIDSAISHQKEIDKNSIQLKIDSLNPQEGASIALLYQSIKTDSSGAAVSLRAKGITGKLIGSNKKEKKESIWISLVAAYVGIAAFILSTKKGRIMLPIVVRSLLSGRSIGGSQKNVIASTLSMYGYPEKAKEYLNSEANRQYWVEADLLSSEAINGNEKLKKDTIQILLTICETQYMAESSKAITYYNIARIYKALNTENKKIDEYLHLAKDIDKKEIEERLSHDPVFS
ncbi:hypothetical protein KA005_59175 [bacterium]|nr:hypothetical protein [bacterium]